MRPKNLEKEQAIRTLALEIISKEGLENLSMQKLAKAANISPRTIYIKYENKEDLLVKLFINEVLEIYEVAILNDFDEKMDFEAGVKKLWTNAFEFLTANKPSFRLMQYSRSSPLLNKAYQQANIKQGQFFKPVHRFLRSKVAEGTIPDYHDDIFRALLFSPLLDLVNEYFDYQDRPQQIITPAIVNQCCEAVIKGMKK